MHLADHHSTGLLELAHTPLRLCGFLVEERDALVNLHPEARDVALDIDVILDAERDAVQRALLLASSPPLGGCLGSRKDFLLVMPAPGIGVLGRRADETQQRLGHL